MLIGVALDNIDVRPGGIVVEIVLEKDAKQERSLSPFGLGLAPRFASRT